MELNLKLLLLMSEFRLFRYKMFSVTDFRYLKVYININFIYSLFWYTEQNSILIKYYEVINISALKIETISK